ncbi:FtsB family cell division protein [Sporohalobacter salinus]|uniref:FtsB family cell division protein n=1 Tax=Sporohalobacter salinus TaxID=1494606 RepID=UPI00195F53EB|nr:septum formation initiator family protein [Sporohalobacter salinus]MBM7623882.1 cell division protein FtsB [Sporohalobacter salinus]
MPNKKIINFIKKIVASKKFILIVLIILISAVYSFFRVSSRVKNMKERLNNLEAQSESLDREVKVLDKKLEHVNSKEFVKEIARKELGLIEPGETLYIVVDEKVGGRKNESDK